ncbi:MAG: transcription antitermination factor NusB [Burkholderiales bacterium]|nr:transcription antitermination factor NusB [Burkholderiales bacterium]
MASDKSDRAAGGGKTSRRRSREFAAQGIYQWLLSAETPDRILAHLAEREDFARADAEHCSALIRGAIREVEALRTALAPHLDRPINALSPVEHAILLLATFELTRHLEIPRRVVINEAIEIAKRFGGADGYKYVNGVLDRLAKIARAAEQ